MKIDRFDTKELGLEMGVKFNSDSTDYFVVKLLTLSPVPLFFGVRSSGVGDRKYGFLSHIVIAKS